MKNALFWVVTQQVVVIFNDVSGQPIAPIFGDQDLKKIFPEKRKFPCPG
jgi:hypothetical protein